MYVNTLNDVLVYYNNMDAKKNTADIKKEVGMRIKESRKQAGYTQLVAAKKLYMTQQQYSRFENGIYELNYCQLIEISKIYDVSVDYLLGTKTY